MLQDLQEWFFWDPTTVSSLVMAGVALVGLVLFYVFVRKPKKKEVVNDSYEEFLAEEFKIVPSKEIEYLQLPPEPVIELSEELVVVKPVVKKTAKKTVKKTAKKTVKAKAVKK